MNALDSAVDERAVAMRQAFDRVFAEPAQIERPETVDFLGIETDTQNYALALSEVAGLFARKRITHIPAPLPALIGIAGFRGSIAPVYDLPMLLGHGRTEAPGWLVTVATAPIALAFGQFGGHLRVVRSAIILGGGEGHMIRAHINMDGTIWPIVHMPAILATIGRQEPDGHVGEDREHV